MSTDYALFFGGDIDEMGRGPAPLPEGDYPVLIQQYSKGTTKNKGTPYIRLSGIYCGWPEGAAPQAGVDISKRAWYTDFFTTPDARWRLAKFLKQNGITGELNESAVMQLIGRTALGVVRHRMRSDNGEPVAEVRELIGTGA